LTITPADHAEFAEVACEEYVWNNETFTATGDYTRTFTNIAGCDSVVTLHLTINHSTTGDTTAVECDSFTWHGVNYTSTPAVAPSYTYQTVHGCDSVVTLHLTITPADHAEFAEVACEEYVWNNETFTATGNYTRTFTNMAGCDSVVTLHLTINHSTSSDTTATACESFIWHGNVLNTTGTYRDTLTNAIGCDSVVTLYLTIHNSAHTDEYLTICENELPYTYGDTVFEVGTSAFSIFDSHFSTIDGCDSVVTLYLTVNPNVTYEFSITTSDSCYIWNGLSYCTSGDYIQTLQTVHGCDSIAIMHLTITVGIDDHDLSGIDVFPNPTNSILNIKGEEMQRIVIYNDNGQVVYADGSVIAGLKQVDVSRFAAGQYFVKIQIGDGRIVTKKFIVSRR
jgi:sulfur transfer protein SufE